MSVVTLISGVERRRRWSADQKSALVAAAFAPGAVVAEIARQSELSPGQIYRWRSELDRGGRSGGVAGFSRVVVAPPERPETGGPEVIVVELPGAIVRIGATASSASIEATLKAFVR